jgi:hypothetical protein
MRIWSWKRLGDEGRLCPRMYERSDNGVNMFIEIGGNFKKIRLMFLDGR